MQCSVAVETHAFVVQTPVFNCIFLKVDVALNCLIPFSLFAFAFAFASPMRGWLRYREGSLRASFDSIRHYNRTNAIGYQLSDSKSDQLRQRTLARWAEQRRLRSSARSVLLRLYKLVRTDVLRVALSQWRVTVRAWSPVALRARYWRLWEHLKAWRGAHKAVSVCKCVRLFECLRVLCVSVLYNIQSIHNSSSLPYYCLCAIVQAGTL